MGGLGRLGTLVALVGFGLVVLGTYAVLEGPGYGLALNFMILGLFVILAGMLIVSLSRRDPGSNVGF